MHSHAGKGTPRFCQPEVEFRPKRRAGRMKAARSSPIQTQAGVLQISLCEVTANSLRRLRWDCKSLVFFRFHPTKIDPSRRPSDCAGPLVPWPRGCLVSQVSEASPGAPKFIGRNNQSRGHRTRASAPAARVSCLCSRCAGTCGPGRRERCRGRRRWQPGSPSPPKAARG